MSQLAWIISPLRRPGMVQIGRYFTLTLFLLLMIGVLTAAQISHAFMTASGGSGGVSAIAIKDEAEALRALEDSRDTERLALLGLRTQQTQMRQTIGQASILAYAQKVQFRRFIFACYPEASAAATAAQTAQTEAQASELSWYALLNVYRAATEERARPGCDASLAPAAGSMTSFYGRPHADLVAALRPCETVRGRQILLECLWDNVTNGVWLTSAAEQAQTSIGAEITERETYIASLEARQNARSAFADPAGRAAIAAWNQLRTPGSGWLRDRVGTTVATLVTFPILVQSALLALLAGAVGGGLAQLWDLLGYRRSRTRSLDRAASAVTREMQRPVTPADAASPQFEMLANEISRARQSLNAAERSSRAADFAPLVTGMMSGAGSALVFWLLTTSGLFVLSGGDNVASASPNVLLALSLAAGMAFRQVIGRIFEITEDYVGDRDQDVSAKEAT